MDVHLVASHRSILGAGPVVSYAAVSKRTAHGDVKLVSHGHGLASLFGGSQDVIGRIVAIAAEMFRTGAVVVAVDDQRVFQLLRLTQ